MTDPEEGIAWSLKTFGRGGPVMRRLIPQLTYDCHRQFAAAQAYVEMDAELVYGAIWLKVHREMSRVLPEQIPGARLVRPRRASYSVVLVNDVPVYPLKYARNSKTDPQGCRPGRPSPTRVRILTGQLKDEGAPLLPLEWPEPSAKLTPQEQRIADKVARACDAMREVAEDKPAVVASLYSSSASALHRIVWGDVRLNSDWSVSLGFNEDLIWIADAMSAVADDRQAGGAGYLLGGRSVKDGFDSGPVAEAELRHRRPDEEQPGPGGKIQSEGDDVEEGKEVGADGAE